MAKTPEELAQEMTNKIDGFKTELANAATKEMATAIEKKIDDFIEANKGDVEGVKAQLTDLSEQLNVIKDKFPEGGETSKDGYFVKFVKEQIEKEKPETSANYSAKTSVNAKDLFTQKDPALMTTANVIPNVSNGFNQLFGNYIDSTIYSAPKRDAFILPLVDVTTQPGTESIWYVERVNEEGDAAFIGEGDPKPLADAEWQSKKAPIKEVAVFWKFSKRLAQNAPAVVTDFRTHANELIDLELDEGVYSGDGTGDELEGVIELASAFVVPTELANYYEMPNIYDAIMAMATTVRLGNFKGDITAVLNPVWQAKMAGIKNLEGDYIVPPFVTRDGLQVGEVRVVFNNGVAGDEITVGILKNFKAVIAQNVEYYEGYENDDFRRNLMSKKLEAFVGTYLPANLVNSIIHDDIATVLTAIDADVTPSV